LPLAAIRIFSSAFVENVNGLFVRVPKENTVDVDVILEDTALETISSSNEPPLLLNLAFEPLTSNLYVGDVVPIPTLVPSSNIIAPVLPIVVAEVNLAT